MASGVWGGSGMADLGARGDRGKPALGDIGMELAAAFIWRGIGEFGGLSPGRGLIGNPGLIKDGVVLFRCSMPEASDTARLRTISTGLAVAWKIGGRGASRAGSWAICSAGCGTGAGTSILSAEGLLLLFFSFFDWLRCSSSCRAKTSRSRSSSSRVFLRPLSMYSERALSGSSSYSESEASTILFTMLGSVFGASSFRGAGGAFLVLGLE